MEMEQNKPASGVEWKMEIGGRGGGRPERRRVAPPPQKEGEIQNKNYIYKYIDIETPS